MNLVFLGPPGVGKGTAAQKVAQERAIPHVSTGDLFRAAMAEGNELGARVRAIVNRGDLVPDEVTVQLVRQRVSREDACGGFILDGFPRTLDQARALEQFAPVDGAVLFSLPDEEIIRRLSGRRVCGSCAAIYHIQDIPPRRPGVCDACGTALVQREDDQPQSIQKRLSLFRSQTQPVIRYYEQRGLLKRIDSSGSPHETYAQVRIQLRGIERSPSS